MPLRSHRVPDYAVMPSVDLPSLKRRATRAWHDAKEAGAAPIGMLDRWHTDMLLAIEGAPEHAAAVMFYRSEVLYRLLIDRLRWL